MLVRKICLCLNFAHYKIIFAAESTVSKFICTFAKSNLKKPYKHQRRNLIWQPVHSKNKNFSRRYGPLPRTCATRSMVGISKAMCLASFSIVLYPKILQTTSTRCSARPVIPASITLNFPTTRPSRLAKNSSRKKASSSYRPSSFAMSETRQRTTQTSTSPSPRFSRLSRLRLSVQIARTT